MKFALYTPGDDAGLRRLAREEAMPGWIRLAYTREPSWEAGQEVLGHRHQTIVATDSSGTLVGCGVRAVRRTFINGLETEIGYLCGLRSIPRARRSTGLARGYRFIHKLHDADHLVPAYLTTILEDNPLAMTILTSERAGLPAYLDYGRFITSAIPLGHRRAASMPKGFQVCPCNETSLDPMLRFLKEEGSRRQFFPVLHRSDFGSPTLSGLAPTDFRIVWRDGTIAGIAAAWDQNAIRQALVTGYAPAIRWTRLVLNGALRLAGRRPLPPAGRNLRLAHIAFLCIRNDDPSVLAALLEQIHAEHRNAPVDYLVVGLHERDPLRKALLRFPSHSYTSRLFLVRWEEGRAFCESLDPDRIPHLETAML